MNMNLASTIFFLFISIMPVQELSAADPPKQEVRQALQQFAGTWKIVSSEPAGVTKEATQLVFRKDLTYAALDQNGKELWSGTFDLDPAAKPKIWDHRSHAARKEGGDALGIYELDGDQLKVACVVGAWKSKEWTGKPRPAVFKLPEADVVLQLQRQATGP
ncbi:TIGR03067 domain-containing protein [Gimesia sp.]|uniref:TIGR03067 domain-containing protein n=1 Tax=Gimesia sp. TaxID=2024833 RepID=UPI000C57554C|nr:TIGR03067 domain-containing protein [Gimesia sp.]MAX38536.1 TIGR03067 domain-containing protein [Gimesia sp.]HAH43822.1 TIGR03067 domain-containing protein [Planctomycetaceae bacterium]HBL46170.1 TIGR03067 domain-containing protein [Planctomycetaceae bacterium]|tara:strand:+ start:2451 stop:2933 length:483 start_codon:yes stop_codon:yes gene_type:complete